MFGSDPIGAATIAGLVESAWGVECEAVEYAPIGYGSYHWYATGSGSRWLVTADGSDVPQVAAAYRLAHDLGKRFDFVRSPLAGSDGGVVVGHDDWLISVWPWVEGRSGEFGDEQSAAEVAAVSRCLRMLHDSTEVSMDPVLVDDWGIDGRTGLDEALEGPEGKGGTGPYASEVGDLVAANQSRLFNMLAEFDELTAQVREEAELVVTHGEPHVANVVHTESGPVLIDWDTVRWAPRERDLWWLSGESWRESYGLDQPVSAPAIEMYRLRWALSDVADFVPALMAAPRPSPDLDVAMEWLRKLLPRRAR